MKKLLLPAAILVVLTSLIFLNCTKNIAGGTEVGNPSVSAMLYEPDGKTPAVGAKVKFYPVDNNPLPALHKALAAIDSTITDSNGRYSIASVTAGTYNIIGSKDGNKSLLDSIKISSTTTSIQSDTLLATGSLTGVVRLRPEHSSTNVYILIFGTNTFTSPVDSVGNFTLDSMAGGTYRVKILTTLPNYVPLDTSFTIRAGKRDTLADTIRLKYTGIPVVEGLTINYDTLKQIVTVTWSKADAALVKSYNIYRRNVGLNTVMMRINTNPVTITSYSDSTGVQDSTYEYCVAAVNGNAIEGMKSGGKMVVFAGLYSFALSFGPEGSSNGFTNQHGICFGLDSVILVADYQNSKIKRFTAQGHFLDQFGTGGIGDGQLDHVLDVAIDESGYIYTTEYNHPRIQKYDVQGNFIKTWQIPDRGAFTALVIYDTLIYTTYVYSNKIECYSLNGDSLKEFSLPTDFGIYSLGGWDITADKQGNIYVAVQNEVYVLDNNGNLTKSFSLVPGSSVDPDPRCIALDTTGNILVACLSDLLIRVYDQTGNYIAKWGAPGNAAGQFTFFSSMIVTPGNSVFVSDGDLGRIQKFLRN